MSTPFTPTTWGNEIVLEYGKSLRTYSQEAAAYRVFGTNGPIGWHDEALAAGPGVILGRKGANRGVEYWPEPFWVIDTAYYVRPLTDLNMRWLYYAIIHYRLGDVDDGSPIPSTTRAAVYPMPFAKPERWEQDAIAELLGSLDDKIEMNRRMTATVEAMAQALFKSWLVDFDPVHARAAGVPTGLPAELEALLPNSFDGDNLPRGWTLTPLTAIAEFLNGLALQKFPAVAGEDSLPVIKISEMRGGPRSNSGQAAATIPTQYRIEDGDHLFSWSGSLTHCLWSHGPGALNQHLFKVTAKAHPNWLAYWAVDHFLPEFRAIAAEKAVTMGHIQRHHLDEAVLAMPPRPLLNELSRTFTPLHHRLLSLALEAKTLERLRDTLLPRLISGQLRIDTAACEVAEA